MSKKIDVLSKCKKNERRYILMPADDLKALFFFMSSSWTDFSFFASCQRKAHALQFSKASPFFNNE